MRTACNYCGCACTSNLNPTCMCIEVAYHHNNNTFLILLLLDDFINFLYKQIFELEKIDRQLGIEPGSLDYMLSVIPLDHRPSCFLKLISSQIRALCGRMRTACNYCGCACALNLNPMRMHIPFNV